MLLHRNLASPAGRLLGQARIVVLYPRRQSGCREESPSLTSHTPSEWRSGSRPVRGVECRTIGVVRRCLAIEVLETHPEAVRVHLWAAASPICQLISCRGT